MPPIVDCLYTTLGVPKDANRQDIKAAYLAKAREFHPDKRPGCDATLKYFTHVTKAYETLGDEQKRAIYDDESIPDEEYFKVSVGGIKVNLFVICGLVALAAVGFGVRKVYTRTMDAGKCPLEHRERQDMVNTGKQNY